MRLVVTGGTGFVGRALVAGALAEGHEVTVLTRAASPSLPAGADAVRWPQGEDWRRALDGAAAVVHLAGESTAGRRWDAARKALIRSSRVDGTRALVEALAGAAARPPVLISGSAVGYYGPRGDEEIREEEAAGGDFLSEVCVAWEREAESAAALGVRACLLRTGLVLERDGGGLPRLVAPFRHFLGGPLGSGRQWMSWIHRDDLVRLIRFLIDTPAARGPFNAVAPNPATNLAFSRALARVLRRPCRLRVPALALRAALGEMADLLLTGQRAVPARALDLGFRFRYPDIEPALRAILGGS